MDGHEDKWITWLSTNIYKNDADEEDMSEIRDRCMNKWDFGLVPSHGNIRERKKKIR